MPTAEHIVLSLTGPRSHTLVREPGRGDLRVGPASPGGPPPDLVVDADDTLAWSAFDPLKVPAGYPWPRQIHYRGNDQGFLRWSVKRRIETFEWTPVADAVVDARHARIGELVVHLAAVSLDLVLPTSTDRVAFRGDWSRLRPSLPARAACPALAFRPHTKPSRDAAPISLPRFAALAGATSVEVSVEPLRQPFDCASLLQFPKLESVALRGQLAGLEALARLPHLTDLELRYCPDLSGLPPLDAWPKLTRIIGWNVEESVGKRLRAEIKHLAKSAGREWDFASVTQLRRLDWFTKEYGLPFSAWPKRTAKTAVAAFKAAQASIAAARARAQVERAIRTFVQVVNALPDIETTEREDAAEAVTQLAAGAPLKVPAELARFLVR